MFIRKITLFTLTVLLFTSGFANIKNIDTNKQNIYKNFFITLEGDYIFPDKDSVSPSQLSSTSLYNQKIDNKLSYSGGVGYIFNNGIFIVAKYRKVNPKDTFTINSASDGISNWVEKWDFNYFDLDLGKTIRARNNVDAHAYLGLGIMRSNIKADKTATDPAASPQTESQKLELNGFGPKVGLGVGYWFTKRIALVGGVETTFFFSKFKRLTSTDGSAYVSDLSNFHTDIPIINAFIGGNFNVSNSLRLQAGYRVFHTFNFDTNAFMTIYNGTFIANDIGWVGPYLSISFRF